MVVDGNRWIQGTTTRRLVIAVGMTVISVVLSFLFWPKVEYLPNGNRNLVIGFLLPPAGYNLDELRRLGETVETKLKPYWDIDPDDPNIKNLDHPAIADFFFVARGRQVIIGLRAVEPTRARELIPAIMGLTPHLPGSAAFANQTSLFARGLQSSRSIDVEISGPELEELVRYGGMIMGQVPPALEPDLKPLADGRMPYQTQPRPIPSLDLSSPEVHVTPKLMQSSELGVTADDLGYTVNALVDGAYATDYFDAGKKIDLSIVGAYQVAERTQDIESLPVATPMGQLVPLGSVADVRLSSGPEQINHSERRRAITIQVTPPPEMALADAIDKINARVIGPLRDSGQLKPEYTILMSGTADKLRNTWTALRGNVILAMLITYLLMAALFESWTHPFIVITSVPLGAVGGILGLNLLNGYLLLLGDLPQALDVLTMLGFIILIGTVVNNPILIVHQALNHMREDAMTPEESILESVRTRIRPIFMTTLTTVIGLAPLVLFPGAGSELYRGLGAVVLGGLAVSTVFTLVFIPSVFTLTIEAQDRLRLMLRRSGRHEPSGRSREPERVERPRVAAGAAGQA
jgi:HAE1 family hydrophobic/amphiphilic exporter-1